MGIDRALTTTKTAFAAVLESAYATAADQQTASVLDAIEGSNVEFQQREEHDNPSRRPDRDGYASLSGKYQPAPFSLVHNVGLNVGPGTGIALDSMIEAGLGGTPYATQSGDTCGASCTTTKIVTPDGSNYSLLDVIGVNGEYRAVNKIDTNDVYVDPPLSAAPAQNDAITQTKVFRLGDDQKTMSVFMLQDLMLKLGYGCLAEKLEIETPGGAETKLTVSGNAAYVKQLMATKLAANITDAASASITFTVDDYDFLTAGLYVSIGTEIGMEITAVNTSTGEITVNRPASKSTHSTGDSVVPYWPTSSGNLPACKGMKSSMVMKNGSTLSTINFENFSLSVELGAQHYNNEAGYDGPSEAAFGKRSYSFNISGLLRRADFDNIRAAENRTYFSFLHHAATEDLAHGVVVYIARARMKTSISEGDPHMNQSIECVVDIAQDADGNEIDNGSVVIARY